MDNTGFKNKHIIDSVFVICLMLLFVLSALSVIAIGATIYRKNVSSMSTNDSHRIASSYITEKVRQADENGMVTVKEIFRENALVLTKEVGGSLYNTYIYDYDGYLMELFARDDLGQFYPQSGQKILEIDSFDIQSVSENLMNVTVVLKDGTRDFLYITKRSSAQN